VASSRSSSSSAEAMARMSRAIRGSTR
jgi:hypothetical protein